MATPETATAITPGVTTTTVLSGAQIQQISEYQMVVHVVSIVALMVLGIIANVYFYGGATAAGFAAANVWAWASVDSAFAVFMSYYFSQINLTANALTASTSSTSSTAPAS